MNLAEIAKGSPERVAEIGWRFWSKVDVRGEDECWPWRASCCDHGKARLNYGRFSIGSGRVMTAHRAGYLLTNGEAPEGLFVCHTCDNPPCCNPAHLFLGTGKDNAEDRDHKGRYVFGDLPKGSANHNAKLTDDLVAEARSRVAAGECVKPIAREWGVHDGTVLNAVKGRTWRHVSAPTVSSGTLKRNQSQAQSAHMKARYA